MKSIVWLIASGSLVACAAAQTEAQGPESVEQSGPNAADSKESADPDSRTTRSRLTSRPRARTTRQLLSARLSRVEFEEAPLELVFEQLGQYLGISVVVQWHMLEAEGVERDTPITMRVRNLRFSQILWLVMNEASSDVKLGYRATPNLLIVTTKADIERDMVVQVYDVRDLIVTVPFQAGIVVGGVHDVVTATGPRVLNSLPAFQTQQVTTGSVRLFTNGDDEENFRRELRDGPDRNMQELIDVIVNTIEPDTWTVNGGAGAIRPFKGQLIIRNSPLVHQKIGGSLPGGTFR